MYSFLAHRVTVEKREVGGWVGRSEGVRIGWGSGLMGWAVGRLPDWLFEPITKRERPFWSSLLACSVERKEMEKMGPKITPLFLFK